MEVSDLGSITESMWAYLTIKQLLTAAEGEEQPTAKAQLHARAKALALKVSSIRYVFICTSIYL